MPSSGDKRAMSLDAASETRLELLSKSTRDRWVALSSDETRIVATGKTFAEVADAVERSGETDPILLRVPEDWTPRVF
jgi:hypothetical protein